MTDKKAIRYIHVIGDECVATLSNDETVQLAMEVRGEETTFKQKIGNKIVPVGSKLSTCFITEKTKVVYM